MMKKYSVKRLAAVGLSILMLSGCKGGIGASDNPKPGSGEKVSLYDRGLKLIAKMDLMAESEEYTQMMSSSPDVIKVVKEIGDGDYSAPKGVYEVKLSEDALKNLLDVYGGSPIDSLPEDLQGDLKHRIALSVPTMLSAMEGADVLAAVSLIVADDYFVDESIKEDTTYFYIYDGRCCGAVVFSVHDDGIVAASGRMVISDIPGESMGQEDVKEWLVENAGLLGAEITEVSP